MRNGQHFAVGREERLHVHDHVLLQRQAPDGLDPDRLLGVEVFDQGLVREPIAVVDAHRVGPQIPWAHDRRKVRVPSISSWIFCSTVRI